MKKKNEEISVKDLVDIFLPKIWIIVLCAVVLSLILGAHAMFMTSDTYTSRSEFIISRDGAEQGTLADIDYFTTVVGIVKKVFLGTDYLNTLVDEIKAEYTNVGWDFLSAKYLRNVISITANDNSTFTISVTTTNNKIAHYIALVVYEQIKSDAFLQYLPSTFSSIDIHPYESPVLATAKNSKGVFTKVIIGLLIGIVGSMVVIYVVNLFDVVIRDRKKLEDNFDIPVLGVIPRYDAPEDKTKEGAKE